MTSIWNAEWKAQDRAAKLTARLAKERAGRRCACGVALSVYNAHTLCSVCAEVAPVGSAPPACSTDSARLFESKIPVERLQAKILCQSCPIRDTCLDEALSLLHTDNRPRSIYAGADPGDLWKLKTPAARERHFTALDQLEIPKPQTLEERRAYHALKSREWRAKRRAIS